MAKRKKNKDEIQAASSEAVTPVTNSIFPELATTQNSVPSVTLSDADFPQFFAKDITTSGPSSSTTTTAAPTTTTTTTTANPSDTYNLLTINQDTSAEVTYSANVTSSARVSINSYITEPTQPGTSILPAGIWRFIVYGYVNSAASATYIDFDVYKRTSGGTETLLFTASTPELNNTTVEAIITDYSFGSDTALNTSDRIVVKVFARTTSGSTIAVNFVHSGTTKVSNVLTPVFG